MDRRDFLLKMPAMGAAAALPSFAAFDAHASGGGRASELHAMLARRGMESRTLWMTRPQSGEEVRLRYASGRTVLREGYLRACHLLRDVRADEVRPIDIRLLDMMSAMQNWLAVNGVSRPINVQSGYRSQRTNQSIDGAARNSMHLYGRAVDFHIPDVSVSMLNNMASFLREGGVGLYANRGFIHVDTGRIRSW